MLQIWLCVMWMSAFPTQISDTRWCNASREMHRWGLYFTLVLLTVCWSYDYELSEKATIQPAVYSVCERKVIRVIVTSTMIKLGQCNPHPPPPQAKLKKEKKKRERERWGCHHQSLCVDISMGTLERGWLSLWVGICVVLGTEGIQRLFLTCSFLPCSLCFTVSRYNLSLCINFIPTLFCPPQVLL